MTTDEAQKIVNPWSDTLVRGRPRREDQSRNGVRVIVTRSEDGSTVDADCQCFGSPLRVHSSLRCPLRATAGREPNRKADR